MIIKAKNLHLGYNGKTVLELPKLAVGENLLIAGKSGSGKTTLLHSLAGLLKPISGEIEIAGQNINKIPDNFRGQNIGIIFQTLHMINALSVIDNILVASFLADKKQDTARAKELLKMLGIENLAHKKPSEISHGQAQRVAIARAAINNPKVIFGDEPTSALDDDSCDKVINLLKQVASSTGAVLVVASHDARLNKHFAKALKLGGRNE